MVSPPPDVGAKPPLATGTTAALPASLPERGAPPPGASVPASDWADIKPLDIAAALQILVAEVRAAFDLLLIEAGSTDTEPAADGNPASAAAQASGASGAVAVASGGAVDAAAANIEGLVPAARALVEIVLQSLPVTLDERAWGAAVAQTELALQNGIQGAVETVSAWRDVPPLVVDATLQSGRLALNVLSDEPQNPLWLRAEWSMMAPQLTRFWRRRRAFRRRLSDPDYETAEIWDKADRHENDESSR